MSLLREKEKKVWHITTATHNSRYSQRMFENHVILGKSVWLSEKEEQIVTETIANIVKEDNLNIYAYNICGDHMHILLVCEKENLPKIVQKIKSMTARACNIAMGRTISSTREHAPLSKDVPDSISTAKQEHVLLSKDVPSSISTAKQEPAPLSKDWPSTMSEAKQEHVPLSKDGPSTMSEAKQEHVLLSKDVPSSISTAKQEPAPLSKDGPSSMSESKQEHVLLSKREPSSISTAKEEHVPLSKSVPNNMSVTNREHTPLSKGVPDSGSTTKTTQDLLTETKKGRGTTQAHLWTQKFYKKEITSPKQFYNTMKYIRNNRNKHKLSENKRLKDIIKRMTTYPNTFSSERIKADLMGDLNNYGGIY